MTSKAELKRLFTVAPLVMAERVHELERERDALREVLTGMIRQFQYTDENDGDAAVVISACNTLNTPPVQLVRSDD